MDHELREQLEKDDEVLNTVFQNVNNKEEDLLKLIIDDPSYKQILVLSIIASNMVSQENIDQGCLMQDIFSKMSEIHSRLGNYLKETKELLQWLILKL